MQNNTGVTRKSPLKRGVFLSETAGKRREDRGRPKKRKTEHRNRYNLAKVFGFLAGQGSAATPIKTRYTSGEGQSDKQKKNKTVNVL